jgi:signal transduction histidine kinase
MKGLLETSVIQAELKGLKFKISVDSSIPKYILSDPQKIQNVLFNIISNSIKYTMIGEVKVTIQLKEIEESKQV